MPTMEFPPRDLVNNYVEYERHVCVCFFLHFWVYKEKGPPLAARAGPETKALYLVYSLVGQKAGCSS